MIRLIIAFLGLSPQWFGLRRKMGFHGFTFSSFSLSGSDSRICDTGGQEEEEGAKIVPSKITVMGCKSADLLWIISIFISFFQCYNP